MVIIVVVFVIGLVGVVVGYVGDVRVYFICGGKLWWLMVDYILVDKM